MSYVPGTYDGGDVGLYLQQELQRISEVIIPVADGEILKRHVVPTHPRNGLFYADGADWDPGNGEGIYVYDEDSAAFEFVGGAGAGAGVDSFEGRSGTVTALQADYDGFFLTPAEGDAAYSLLGHLHDSIVDTDLLDKTAVETVSANLWTFDYSPNLGFLQIVSTTAPDTVGDVGTRLNYLASGASPKPTGWTDASLITMAYSAAWQTQIAADWRQDGLLAVRGQNNGVWSSWHEVPMVDVAATIDAIYTFGTNPVIDAAGIASGTFANARIAVGNVTQHVASINHDALLNFVAQEHIRWDLTGAEDIHAARFANAPVASVFGRTGAVAAQQADYDGFFLTPAEGNAAYAPIGSHPHSAFDRASSVLSGANVFSNIVVADGITTAIATRAMSINDLGGPYNNYTHPAHPGDDFSVDSTLLSGATVISDIDINVTTDAEGHVTDANGSIATRALTPANIGALAAGATAVNSQLLDSIDSLSFLRSNVADQKTSGALRFNDNIELNFGNSDDIRMDWDGVDLNLRAAATNRVFNWNDGLELWLWDETEANALALHFSAGAGVIATNTNTPVDLRQNNVSELRTQDHTATGVVTGAASKDSQGNLRNVGFADMKAVPKSSALTIGPTHIHKTIRITNVTGSITFANDSNMAVDTVGWIINTTTSDQVLAATSNNLEIFLGDGVASATGNKTLAGKGWCTWRKLSNTEYELVGVGLS